MAGPGGCVTMATGNTREQILATKLDCGGASTIRARAIIYPTYTKKYYMPHVNGVYTGVNEYVEYGQMFEKVYPVDPETTSASFYLEDAGDWRQFPDAFIT